MNSTRYPLVPNLSTHQISNLPSDWITSVIHVVRTYSVDAVLAGGQSTSLERPGVNIPYKLVTGDVVAAKLPWLDALYRTHFLDLASSAAGTTMLPSSSVVNGVNINVLIGRGARYESHLDSNPLTGVLFVTRHDAASGGQLIFEPPGAAPLAIDPLPGLLALFDARSVPHAVSPLVDEDGMRVSIPMNFFRADEGESRPQDLDEYLYAAIATRRAD